MVFGSDCTHYDAASGRFCGRPTKWVQRHLRTGAPINVLCNDHFGPACDVIPVDASRAPQSAWLLRADDRDARPTPPAPEE